MIMVQSPDNILNSHSNMLNPDDLMLNSQDILNSASQDIFSLETGNNGVVPTNYSPKVEFTTKQEVSPFKNNNNNSSSSPFLNKSKNNNSQIINSANSPSSFNQHLSKQAIQPNMIIQSESNINANVVPQSTVRSFITESWA